MAHAVIVEMLQRNNWKDLLAGFLASLANKDEGVRKVLNVLAATQQIELARKDALRKEIRAFFKATYGDRKFFADSDLHRKRR